MRSNKQKVALSRNFMKFQLLGAKSNLSMMRDNLTEEEKEAIDRAADNIKDALENWDSITHEIIWNTKNNEEK
jgi:hypothetical protein